MWLYNTVAFKVPGTYLMHTRYNPSASIPLFSQGVNNYQHKYQGDEHVDEHVGK